MGSTNNRTPTVEMKVQKQDENPSDLGEFSKVNWGTSGAILVHHLLGIWGLVKLLTGEGRWETTLFCIALGEIGVLGGTLGAHRLWSHRCYEARTPLKILLMVWQTLSGQRSIWRWSAWHRVHHKFTDTPLDPHNASRGFWYSHVGWLILYDHKIFLEHQKRISMTDLNNDSVVMWQKRNYNWFYPLIAFVLPTIFPWLLWDESLWLGFLVAVHLRYVISCHRAWCINSVAHMWGDKPYDKTIKPVENLFASVISQGEGWHNYHHAFPWDCKASELGLKHWNPSTTLLHLFAKLGWAYNLKSVSEEMLRARRVRTGG